MFHPVQKAPQLEYLKNLCKSNQFDHALKVAYCMDQEGIPIPRDAIYKILQGCSKELENAKRIHLIVIHNKLERVSVLGDHLIRLFVSCASLTDAQRVFLRIPKPSIYTWNAIISAHVTLGESCGALSLYHEMKEKGVQPDIVTFISMLKTCCKMGMLRQCMVIHEHIIRGGFELELVLGNALLDMYCKYGILEEARKVFHVLEKDDVVSWGTLIAGYVQHGHLVSALQLYDRMQREGPDPDQAIFISLLTACGGISVMCQGLSLHCELISKGLCLGTEIENALLDMYSKYGSITSCQKVFDHMLHHDIVSWTTLFIAYVNHGNLEKAMDIYNLMAQRNIVLSEVALVCILQACSNTGSIDLCMHIHFIAISSGHDQSFLVANTLIDAYGTCGEMDDAQAVFNYIPTPLWYHGHLWWLDIHRQEPMARASIILKIC